MDKIALMLPANSDDENMRSEKCVGLSKKEKSELDSMMNDDLMNDVDFLQPMVKKGRVEFDYFREFPENETLDKLGIELIIPVVIQDVGLQRPHGAEGPAAATDALISDRRAVPLVAPVEG